MKRLSYLLVCVALVSLSAPAMAQGIDSFFDVIIEGSASNWNVLGGGGGSGWNASGLGPWFPYEQTVPLVDNNMVIENPPMFWNQWYYDGVYDPTRYKVCDISFDYKMVNPAQGQGYMMIVVNWSTPNWVDPDPLNPSPPMTDFGPGGVPYIGRATIVNDAPIFNAEYLHYSLQDFILPMPYNPEWVSIDVRGYNFQVTGGILTHECVPEPGSMLALGSGLLGLAGMMFRKRR